MDTPQELGNAGGLSARTVMIVASIGLILGAFGTGLGVYATIQVTAR